MDYMKNPQYQLVVMIIAGAFVLTAFFNYLDTQTEEEYDTGTYDFVIKAVDPSASPEVGVYMELNDDKGEPVEGLTVDDFTVVELGEDATILDFQGSGSQRATVVVSIDISGSMEGQKLADAKVAAKAFVDMLVENTDDFGLIAFSTDIYTIYPLQELQSGDKDTIKNEIDALGAGGSTSHYDAIYEGSDSLDGVTGRRVLISMTDGMSNDDVRTLDEAINRANSANVAVYTIGLGGDANQGELLNIANRTGGIYTYSPTSAELTQIYTDILSSLREEILIVYETPHPEFDGTNRDIVVCAKVGDSGQICTSGKYSVGGVIYPTFHIIVFLLFAICFTALLYKPLQKTFRDPKFWLSESGEGDMTLIESMAGRTPSFIPSPEPKEMVEQLISPIAIPEGFGTQTSRSEGGIGGDEITLACDRCGKENRQEASFCAGCGNDIQKHEESPVQQDGTTVCHVCKNDVALGATFCKRCGTSVII